MINTSEIEISRAFSEVNGFINALGDEYKEKIPKNIYYTIMNNRDKGYNPIFQRNETIKNGMLSKEALSLIAALNLEFWCTDENEKKRLKEIYIENTKKEYEKYNSENLLKNNQDNQKYNQNNINIVQHNNNNIQNQGKENIQIIKYKEQKWYRKIFEKIKKFFWKS